MTPRSRVLATVFLLSLTVLLLQVVLSRLFAGLIYDSLYYFPLSMAMLGLSGGGVLLYAFAERFPADPEELARRSLRRALAAAVLFAVATIAVNAASGGLLEPGLLAAADRDSDAAEALFFRTRVPLLLLYGLASVLPFYFLGLAIAALLKGYAHIVNTVYFTDLAGATLGALLAVPALDHLESANYLLVAPLLVALALAVWERPGRLALAVLVALAGAIQLSGVPALEATTLRALRYLPDYRGVDTSWSSTAYLQLVEHEREDPLVLQDHHSAVAVRPFRPGGRGCAPDAGCAVEPWLALAEALRGRPESVCVLAAGVGRQMFEAFELGVPDVVGVEMNPTLLPFAAAGRPDARLEQGMQEPGIRYVVDEARHYMRRTGRRFDLVLIPPSGSPQGTAMPSTPNHLFTGEAIAEYLGRLEDDGLLAITVVAPWRPSGSEVRAAVLGLVREGLHRTGAADPARHVVGFAPGYLYVSRRPFEPDELARAASRAQGLGLRTVGLAQLEAGLVPTRKPITDDYPFWQGASSFSALWADLGRALRLGREPPTAGSLLALTLLVALCLVMLVILFPLLRMRTEQERFRVADSGAVAYFFCLGAGFMFVEVPLMEKLVFALGYPIYSISFCLAVLLTATGLGSLLSGRLLWGAHGLRRGRLTAAFALLIAAQVGLYLGVHPLLTATLALPFGIQIAAVGLAIVPLGLLLGVPFPQGIALLRDSGRGALIPWAWGVNGAASVLAINLSVVLTRIVGITPMFLLALGLYLAALALLRSSLLRTPA